VCVCFALAHKRGPHRLSDGAARRPASNASSRTYAEPLIAAAFDLQTRLYSIVQHNFLKAAAVERGYAEPSTLWLIAQYFAWVEILRREVQYLDVGVEKHNRTIQACSRVSAWTGVTWTSGSRGGHSESSTRSSGQSVS